MRQTEEKGTYKGKEITAVFF